MMRVKVEPHLLQWARERSRLDPDYLCSKFPKLPEWESGDRQPTLRQLEDYARATHAPVGYFFLPEPPVESIPIPDLRTVGENQVSQPLPGGPAEVDAWRERCVSQNEIPTVKELAASDGNPVCVIRAIRLSEEHYRKARLNGSLHLNKRERRDALAGEQTSAH